MHDFLPGQALRMAESVDIVELYIRRGFTSCEGTTMESLSGELTCQYEKRLCDGELANTVTHGIGLALSVIGALVLLVYSSTNGDAWRVAGCSVFAVTLIAVYAASTLSHAISQPRLKQTFRVVDQGVIYLLIVGTYTPFALVYLRTPWWCLFSSLLWFLAFFGFLSKIASYRNKTMPVWTYIMLGWLTGLPTIWMIGSVPPVLLFWIVAGGMCYTAGTVFLILDLKRFHFHAIWHLFVISGSTCHFVAILFYIAVVPVNA